MLGALDMFNIGVGPSSSHTIGPMRAAFNFVSYIEQNNLINLNTRVKVHLFGSLALTGEGHGTTLAILNGLAGQIPKSVDPKLFIELVDIVKSSNKIKLLSKYLIDFVFDEDIKLHKTEFLVQHANGMRFDLVENNSIILSQEYFSIGGGFILDSEEIKNYGQTITNNITIPYPFSNAAELFKLCQEHNLSIAQIVTENELVRKTKAQFREEALEIIQVMHESVIKGINTTGFLPGKLNVKRRAPELFRKLNNSEIKFQEQRLLAMTYAIAVNEENASFGKIVTAPTNGAAGVIPGVLEYYRNFGENVSEDKLIDFLLTAGTIGVLYKLGASISAAEVGCQGEIGVACSMASGALTAVLGGSLTQIEKAAEIAMEHNLGMTCDPIGGLVQIPCIERNAVAASKAIDIARLALLEDQPGLISLDSIIRTMLQTGRDMSFKYKETSLGGLAVNMVNC